MSKSKLEFVYSFECKKEIQNFEIFPEEIQEGIEKNIVNVICESFIEPGDEDYFTARLLAQKGMHRAFFWAASQALEKYLKEYLLMRGVSVKEYGGHPLEKLFQAVKNSGEKFLSISTKFHPAIRINSEASKSLRELSPDEFIKEIENHGSADNRYNSFGVDFDSGCLFALDSFIFHLRNGIGIPSIRHTLRKMDPDLVDAFYRYNPWFSDVEQKYPELPNQIFKLRFSHSVTTLEFLVGRHAPHHAIYALQWLDKKMKLPREVKVQHE